MSASSSQITFSIDHAPSLISSQHSTLAGWAMAGGDEVQIVVYLRGEELFRTVCTVYRPDVHAAFPTSPLSIISGFKVPLPQDLLPSLPPGSLEIVAEAGAARVVVWRWNEGFQTSISQETLASVRSYFKRQSQVRGTAKLRLTAESDSIAVFVALTPDKNFFEKILPQLANISRVTKLFVLNVPESRQAEIRQTVSERSPQLSSALIVSSAAEISLGLLRECASEGAIIRLDDQTDLTWVDLSQMVTDFRENKRIGLLRPTGYGALDSVAVPPRSDLWTLRQRTAVNGVEIPCFYPTKEAGRNWIASKNFLMHLAESLGATAHNILLRDVLASSQSVIFYQDLRQPIQSLRRPSGTELLSDSTSLPSALSALVSTRDTQASRVVIFVIPAEWKDLDGRCGNEYQALRLMRRAVEEGYSVVVVGDGINDTQYSFAEFALWSLGSVSECYAAIQDGCIVCCRWDALRASYVLAYQFGLAVSCLVQEDHRNVFDTWQHDRKALAANAYNSEFVPLFVDSAVREHFETELVGSPEAVVLSREFDDTLFQVPRNGSKRDSVLVMLNSEHLFRESRSTYLHDLMTQLRESQFRVTLVGYDPEDATLRPLLSLATKAVLAPTALEKAELYQSASVAIFVDGGYGLQAGIVEAAASGCFPIVITDTCLDSLSTNRELCMTCSTDIDEIIAACGKCSTQTPQHPSGMLVKQPKGKVLADEINHAWEVMNRRLASDRAPKRPVSIIIPVYNALDITMSCVRLVLKYREDDMHLILVNDASDSGTTNWLREVAAANERVTLVDLPRNGGFVQACHAGLTASDPSHDIILLNSDVLVTREALKRVRAAAYARPRIGLASALSTNSPHLKVPVNIGDSLETAAEKIASLRKPEYPTIITPEGQLLYIRRWALERFGFFDPVYNRGFCEESDMCMRMFLSGVDMVCADDAFIFHKKSASFGDDESTLLKSTNRPIFDGRFGPYYTVAYQTFIDRSPIEPIRRAYASLAPMVELPTEPFALRDEHRNFSFLGHGIDRVQNGRPVIGDAQVVFILPSAIFGGGSLSVLQHVNELLLRGVRARVISLKEPQIKNYPLLAPVIAVSSNQLFELDWSNQIVVATFWSTAFLVKGLTLRYSDLQGYYYIQDYEPWFYSYPEDFHSVNHARESYELGLRGVVKTEFLRDTVKEEHGIDVSLITPGIDRGTFYPGVQDQHIGRPRLSALYRPRTKRRGNSEALELIRRLLKRMPEVEVTLFGSSENIPEDLSARVRFVGELTPSQVAELYRRTDVVMDLSYWHGFGRMGLEGMACGAVPLLSQSGGVLRYARDGINSFLVDFENPKGALEKLIYLLSNRGSRMEMRANALTTAAQFSEQRATDDWLEIWKGKIPATPKERYLVPLPTGSVQAAPTQQVFPS